MKITPDTARRLRRFIDRILDGDEADLAEARDLLRRLGAPAAPAKAAIPSLKVADESAAKIDAAWAEFVGFVRASVFELSRGMCEHCERALGKDLGDMDHSRGGAHRREYTRIDWCRRLCRACHRQRTAEDPSAQYWRDDMVTVRTVRAVRDGDRVRALREEEDARLARLASLGMKGIP